MIFERQMCKSDKAAVREYGAAVESLSGLHGERLRDALVRAHYAHTNLMNEAGFPHRNRADESGKVSLLFVKQF